MSDEPVSRAEFEQLKAEVIAIKKDQEEIKSGMTENSKLLQAIDKKIDVIDTKIVTADKIDDLKLTPLEKRVETLEESKKWLWRTVGASIITIVVGAIVFVLQMK